MLWDVEDRVALVELPDIRDLIELVGMRDYVSCAQDDPLSSVCGEIFPRFQRPLTPN
jgi:hypothetical protein